MDIINDHCYTLIACTLWTTACFVPVQHTMCWFMVQVEYCWSIGKMEHWQHWSLRWNWEDHHTNTWSGFWVHNMQMLSRTWQAVTKIYMKLCRYGLLKMEWKNTHYWMRSARVPHASTLRPASEDEVVTHMSVRVMHLMVHISSLHYREFICTLSVRPHCLWYLWQGCTEGGIE